MEDNYRISLVDDEFERLIQELEEAESMTEDEVIDFCKQNLTYYKVPRKIEFRKELPKSPVGKILKKVLIEEERSRMEKK